jgi:mannose-6-phosphate isomerase-like protein (cupin superfamily)
MEEKLPQKTEKPWGFELVLAHTSKYAGKLMFVRKGHRLSLQYHEKKDETIYVYEGKALFEIEGSDGSTMSAVLQAGQCQRIPPLTKHRIQAIEDTTLFEVSTPELGDVKRLEDDYGRTS